MNHTLYLDTSFHPVNLFRSRFERYFTIFLRINDLVKDPHNKHKCKINTLMN